MAGRARDIIIRFLGDEKDLARSTRNLQGEIAKTDTALEKAGARAKKFGDAFKAAVVGAAAGAVSQMVKQASNLEESINAVDVVFGRSSRAIHDWGEGSAEAAGLATSEFNSAASVIGSALKNAGFDMDTVAEKTIQLTQRAADMASVFNTSVPDALGAIQAALRGESDPIERYGVALAAAKVEAKAAALGFKRVNGEFDAQAKAAARLELILEQTNQVAGDFGNTSDGLANSMRIAQADAKNLAAELGKELLPVLVDLLGGVKDINDTFADDDGALRWRSALFNGIPVLEDWARKSDDATAAAREQAGAHTENMTALELSRGRITKLLEPTATLGTTMATTAGQIRDVANAQKELLSPTFAHAAAVERNREANEALTEAEAALKEAIDKHGTSSDEATEAQENLDEANRNVLTSFIEQEAAAENLANVIDTTLLETLRRTAEQAGLTEAAIRRLLSTSLTGAGVPLVTVRDPNLANQGPAVDVEGGFIPRSAVPAAAGPTTPGEIVINNYNTWNVPDEATATYYAQSSLRTDLARIARGTVRN